MVTKYKIALTGSASTGKTTTAHLLSKKLNLPIQPEIESLMLNDWEKSGKLQSKNNFTLELSKEFFDLALSQREQFCKDYKSYISDRCTAELYVYFKIHLEPRIAEKEGAFCRDFKTRCINNMKEHSHIFLFPYGQLPIELNKLRTTNKEYQLKIHTSIKNILVEFSLNYIQLSDQKLTREERLEEVLTWLRN